MRPKRLFHWLLVMIGVAGMAGLTVWDFYQVRTAAVARNQRWVGRISKMMGSERKLLIRWIEQFPITTATFRDIANSRSDVSGLVILDLKSHERPHWTGNALSGSLEPIDPRLGVLQLETLQSNKAMAGPVLVIQGKPFFTVARALNKNRVLIAFLNAARVWDDLREEAAIWQLRPAIYDHDKRQIFASADTPIPPAALEQTLFLVGQKRSSGIVDLPWAMKWQWLMTYHHDAALEWIFIIAERSVWVYSPIVFFLISMTGILLLARIPFKAATAARREGFAAALSTFAIRLDNYIRGKDAMLADPPSSVRELSMIAATARWLVPQWKKAEAFPRELALERKLLSLLIESLPEGILFFNAQGGPQLSNELGRVFLALEQEGREARMINGVQVPRGFLEPYLEPVFTGGQPNLGKEVEVAWADGKHLYRLWVERVEVETDKTGGFIVVVRDITFRKQWEYVQEQVLSGITHDLRGPLSAVLGYIDLLKRQLGESAAPKVAEYLRMAREAGVRLSQMVTDILDVVRFEQGKIDITLESIPVVELFQRLKNTFEVLAEQKRVHLKLGILGDASLRASGDRKLLERVLDNLVGNAIKFTPPDGTITVSAKSEKDRAVFDIVDTGRGIPREAQSRIFDKFQQVRPGDRSAGYGLGLAVSKFIVEAHKGEIRVESEVGVGSRFSFWLPNQRVEAPDGEPLEKLDPNTVVFPPSGPRAA